MPVLTVLLWSLIGMGVVAVLAAVLYAALPHYFLECAERHGRFGGLGSSMDEAAPKGTPTESVPAGSAKWAAGLSVPTV